MAIVSPLENYQPSSSFRPRSTGRVTLTVIRYPKGTVVNHRYVKGVPQNVIIEGVNIQPMKDNEKLILPEAQRSKEWLKVYSPEALRTLKEGQNGYDADRFEYEGRTYEVAKARIYRMGVQDHCKALAVSVERSPG